MKRLILLPLLALAAGCGADGDSSPAADVLDDTATDTGDVTPDSDADAGETSEDAPGELVEPFVDCPEDGLPYREFDSSEGGTRRHELAGEFSLPLASGGEFVFSANYNGCDAFVFLPDTLPVSQTDAASIWRADIDTLVANSPENAFYLFVSRRSTTTAAESSIEQMQARIDEFLDTLPEADAEYWRGRLLVVATRAQDLENWVGDVMASGIGTTGFAIDRHQRIRGVGNLADVTRYDAALAAAGGWPWQANLAYAAYEARYINTEAREYARQATQDAVVVTLFNGEVISQFADVDVELPSAADMATFDRLEIDVVQMCPNPDVPEFGNCGAWDYLAHLWLFEGEGDAATRIEMARFITTYHREAHMVVDATQALVWLREGGNRRMRWEWAPEWNVQPTATRLTLRFLREGAPHRPAEVTPLFTGGAFNSTYNDNRNAVEVNIPADATRVELRAIITGHGAETQQCAEFCNHQHEFGVNGEWFVREHPTVGDQQGCIDEVDNGMTPNQGGTWWFGRGGWCPGQRVEPWIVDLTDVVDPGGVARVQYNGLLGGRTPPDGAGNILMNSWLVVYR